MALFIPPRLFGMFRIAVGLMADQEDEDPGAYYSGD
jgi:hypothetical protein